MPKIFSRITPFIVPVFIAFIMIGASYFQVFEGYELGALDLRFVLRSTMPTSKDIVIIEIGEDTIKKLGRFPFDRSYHAILVRALSEFGAKAIIFDILFSEPQEDDRDLAIAMKDAGNVYIPFAFDLKPSENSKEKSTSVTSATGYIACCIDDLAVPAKGTGHINILPDSDGKFRRIPPYLEYEGALYPYMPFLVACDYAGIDRKDIKVIPGKNILCGENIRIPLDEKSNMIINYSGKWEDVYKHYSYVDVLQSYLARTMGDKPIINQDSFRDKICLVGLTATGTGDIHPNPFEPLYPGVGIHAEIFNSVVSGRFIQKASRAANVFILMLLGFVISVITLKTKPARGLFYLAASILAFSTVSILLFNTYGIWIDMFYPILTMVLIYLYATMHKYVSEWRKRLMLESELEIARKIQISFLPTTLPSMPGLEVAATMFTAKQVGGDLYDFLDLEDGRLGVMIGDVSGKGVPASLFMAMTTGSFKFFATQNCEPKDVLAKLNSKIVKESSTSLFVSVFYAILNTKTGTMRYSNGGHLPVLRVDKDGKAEFLDTEEGVPLGLMENTYSGREIIFNKGDIMVFYTDGITEAMNARRDMYGPERLLSIVQVSRGLPAEAVLKAIEKDVRKFEPESTQHDDMTILVLKVT